MRRLTRPESAERGRKAAFVVSIMCFVTSIFSLLTFNILMAAVGFAAAYYIKNGSMTARNLEMILRVSDIPVMILIIAITAAMAKNYITVCILAAVTAVLDVAVLLTLIENTDINAYFRAVYESAAVSDDKEQKRKTRIKY